MHQNCSSFHVTHIDSIIAEPIEIITMIALLFMNTKLDSIFSREDKYNEYAMHES